MLGPKLTLWWDAVGFEVAFLATFWLFMLEAWLDERSDQDKPNEVPLHNKVTTPRRNATHVLSWNIL